MIGKVAATTTHTHTHHFSHFTHNTTTSIDKLDLSKFGSAFNINSVGPLRTVRAVTFADSAKFVIVSTMMASVGTSGLNAPFPMPAAYNYRMSKAATNMAMVLLAADLKPK